MRPGKVILVGLLPIVGLCGEPTSPPANSTPATPRPLQAPARLSAGTYEVIFEGNDRRTPEK